MVPAINHTGIQNPNSKLVGNGPGRHLCTSSCCCFRGGWGGVQTWRLHLLLKVGWTAKWGTWLLGWHHISFHMHVILLYVGSPYILGPRSICFRFVICFQWLRPQQRTRSSWGSTWYEDCWPFAIIRCKELIIVMAFFPHTIEISSNKTSFSPSFNFLHIISCDFAPKPPHDTQQKAPVATGLGHVAQQLSLAVNQPIWNICNCQNGWKSSPKWLGVNIPKNIRSFTHHPPSIFESIYLKITIILGVLPQMIILSSQFQVMWSRVPRMATWTVRLLKLCSYRF